MPKHSPGPWSFDATCFDRRIAIRGGKTAYGRPYNIALVNRPGSARDGEDRANARVIAAAPDLLEAAREGLIIAEADIETEKRLIEEWGADEGDSAALEVFTRRRDLIAAAIAKAEGR